MLLLRRRIPWLSLSLSRSSSSSSSPSSPHRLFFRPRALPPPPPTPTTLRFQSTSPPSPSPSPSDPEPQLQLTFTCTADNCGRRSTHTFKRRSYESGIVLLQCPGCKSRHLIADHIGWFKESTQNGTFKTVEDLLRAKGEFVQRGNLYDDGTIEILPEKDEQERNP